MTTNDLRRVERQSVQEQAPKEQIGTVYLWEGGLSADDPNAILPAWGTHARDRALRTLYRSQYAWLAQAAVASVTKKVRQTPWQLRGGRNLSTYYQRVLQEADFGAGWGDFLSKLVLDYLTADYGAYVEIIGAGKSDGPLRGRVTGIAHLDTLRCVPTGNNEYPVIYWSRQSGKMHKMHHTRVGRLIDMPDGDEWRYNCGLSALSRAISMYQQQEELQRYVVGMLSDRPPTGILYNSGMTQGQFDQAREEFAARLESGYSGYMALSSTQQIGGEFLTFRTTPDGFDYINYLESAVNAFATAFGIDRQDIWPLSGKMAGTATQSAVLADKARGMMFGDLLQSIERFINIRVLPPALEFSFEYRDDEADKERAERNAILANTAIALGTYMSVDETRRFLANQSEEFRDVLTDETGAVVELPDDDVTTETAPVTEADDTGEQVTDDTTNEAEPDTDAPVRDENEQTGQRAIQATRLEFEERFADILTEARTGTLPRRRFGIILRGLIQRAGTQAYVDGLQDGGVADGTPDDDDLVRITLLVADQREYINDLARQIYDKGISDAQAAGKPSMWYGGSIQPFYDAGRLSADRNGNYVWILGSTEEHCDDCPRLNNQVHRLKSWAERNLLAGTPGQNTECGGWRCECQLKRTDERARGRW